MKKLVQYIYEDLDIDNMLWKIEIYFKRHKKEHEQFVEIVRKCADDNAVTEDNLETYLKDTDIKLKSLIDFLHDDLYGGPKTTDYLYLFKKIIENILANKSVEM